MDHRSTKLLVLFLLGAIMVLGLSNSDQNLSRKHFNRRHDASQLVNISGVLLSTSGTPIKLAELIITLSTNNVSIVATIVQTDVNGNFQTQITNPNSSVTYQCSISAYTLIPNYFYSNPIATNIVVYAPTSQFVFPAPIILQEGGYGGYELQGQILSIVNNTAIPNAQLLLTVVVGGLTYEAIDTTDSQGNYDLSIFGLTGASYSGTLTLVNIIQGYNASASLATVTFPTGLATILTLAPIKLNASTVCNLVACKVCTTLLQCGTCGYGYTLDPNSLLCDFTADFNGTGTVTVPINPFSLGNIAQIVGTVTGLKVNVTSVLQNAIACFYTSSPTICLGVGGTNSVGSFYINVINENYSGSYNGYLQITQAGYVTNTMKVTINSNQNVLNLGQIILTQLVTSTSL